MAVSNFLLGHWQKGLVIVGVGLVSTLGIGLYQGHLEEQQQELSALMARVDRKVPEVSQEALYGLAPVDDPKDASRMAALEEAARGYEAVATGAVGSGAAQAWIKAAETWTRAGNKEAARAAWEKAHAVKVPGVLEWAATSGYAAALADAGDVDGAAALYRAYANKGEGFLAERALYELGALYEAAGRGTDSASVYDEFTTKHPDSSLTPRVADAIRRVRGAG